MKENYQLFLREKIIKSVKKPKIVTQQPKTFENPNIFDVKSVIIEHPKTSNKLLKTRRETVCSYHVVYAFQIEMALWLPECQRTLCLKQVRNLKFK